MIHAGSNLGKHLGVVRSLSSFVRSDLAAYLTTAHKLPIGREGKKKKGSFPMIGKLPSGKAPKA